MRDSRRRRGSTPPGSPAAVLQPAPPARPRPASRPSTALRAGTRFARAEPDRAQRACTTGPYPGRPPAPAATVLCVAPYERSAPSPAWMRRRAARTRAARRTGMRRCTGCTDSASPHARSRGRTDRRSPGGTRRAGRASRVEDPGRGMSCEPLARRRASSRRARCPVPLDRPTGAGSRRARRRPRAAVRPRCRPRRSSRLLPARSSERLETRNRAPLPAPRRRAPRRPRPQPRASSARRGLPKARLRPPRRCAPRAHEVARRPSRRCGRRRRRRPAWAQASPR